MSPNNTPEAPMAAPLVSSNRHLRLTIAGAMLTMILAALDQNIVNTALPRIVADLGGASHLSWVVTAFLLTSTATTPLYGKLSDMYGRKRLFYLAIAVFLIGSVLCGLAQNMLQLILFRALQGLGAGGLMTLAQTVVGDVVAPRDRGRYQGLFTGVFAVSSVAGPLVGGVLTEALSWRWVFYVNLPVGAAALAMIAIGLRHPPALRRRQIDYPGAGLLAAGTTALLLLLSWAGTLFAWASMPILWLGIAAAGFFVAFVLWERRAPEPIIGLHLFRERVYVSGVVASAMLVFAMMGTTVFLPLYFQLVLGMTPTQAGLMMLPQVAGMIFSSILGGRLVSATGRYKPFLIAGVGAEAIGLCGLAILARLAAPFWAFEFCMLVLGLGMGVAMPNITTSVQNAVNPRELGVATSSMSFLRSLGGALGVALSGALMMAWLNSILADTVQGLDVQALLEHGVRALEGLGAEEQTLVASAYRGAIAMSFTMSGVVMCCAFLLVLTLPALALRKAHEGPAPGAPQAPARQAAE
ncbi:MDR family MFS transporter [Roseomonas gilardii]|uniref:MDR family MFS transporter n=1 Tax=Roseomonas gilardii TaxID=257708 RepID=A0ABU3MFJ8_9PROT|nr:MDR family MFS transporter [Roseomonas gilardii]MDT8331636.1 MDR family MFS transporter [Roseomonas gilardii]PZR15686.1 MAG: MFS transporter [Azospirillum brasilense]